MPAAWVGAASAVVGAYESTQKNGGGGGGGGGPPAYVPTNQAGMDANFNNSYFGYQNQINQGAALTNPLAAFSLTQLSNNPYAGRFQDYSNVAGRTYVDQANRAYTASGHAYDAGNKIYNNAFDPQNSIYNQQKQQLTDSTRAAEYARGIQTSPYGAAVEGNVLGNFQNDWQNQQLQRQNLGINALTNVDRTAQTLGSDAGQMYVLGGQAPYAAHNSIYGDVNQAISGYYGATTPYLNGLQQLQSNSLSYNNYGQGAQNQSFNQGQTNLQNQLNGIQGWSSAANDLSKGWQNWNSRTPTPTPAGDYGGGGGDGGGGTGGGGDAGSYSTGGG